MASNAFDKSMKTPIANSLLSKALQMYSMRAGLGIDTQKSEEIIDFDGSPKSKETIDSDGSLKK